MTTFVLTIIFLVLCWITVAARLVVRHMIKAIGLDDWLMLIGVVSFFTFKGSADLETDHDDCMDGTTLRILSFWWGI